ncbi:unnamed protein product [Soboliphyme baturini]|uniref:Secreted protein n=1 Tax=Soboliphyme baturini TaxID=241478 RepID=A0A183IRP8_9BILA|nr:unnamed protein product [Soboliphyme baturini]
MRAGSTAPSNTFGRRGRFAICSTFLTSFSSKIGVACTSLSSLSVLSDGTAAVSQMMRRLTNRARSISLFVAALGTIHVHLLLQLAAAVVQVFRFCHGYQLVSSFLPLSGVLPSEKCFTGHSSSDLKLNFQVSHDEVLRGLWDQCLFQVLI